MTVTKRITALLACATLVCAALSGCVRRGENDASHVTTIYIGTHARGEDDPTWRNEITGESGMSPDRLRAATEALAVVKERLGVSIEWRSWPHGVTQDILQSVLAGDPYCHIAILSNGFQGSIMAQNVLQPLDKYMDIFENDADAEWIITRKTFGSHYLLNRDLLYITDWPICFNINMIEQVPALKENGRTVYPYDLYREGRWTWSVFEDYLAKIQTYYTGKKSPTGRDVVPFNTRYSYAVLQALHSNGAYLYNGDAMAFDTPEAIEAAEYLESLMQSGLISCSSASFGRSAANGYLQAVDAFANGESVFTNCARWRMGAASTALAERGESMGIIFFPRPDSIPFTEYGESDYEIAISCADSVGLLRGFDEAESRLALEAYKLYKTQFYKSLGRVDSISEYRDTMMANEAIQFGIDIFHPVIGDDNLEVFNMLGSLSENEFGEAMSIIWRYTVNIFGEAVYGVNNSPRYPTAAAQKGYLVYDFMENIAESLKRESAVDAVAPQCALLSDASLVFPAGAASGSDIDWTEYFSASDNVDGDYELRFDGGEILLQGEMEAQREGEAAKFKRGRFEVDASAVDFNAVGAYDGGVVVKVTDSSGNVGERKFTLHVYDEKNTRAPILELKEEPDSLDIDADTSKVNWGDFTQTARDVTGIDLKKFVKADVSLLDVTVPGVYPVTLYVVDFAGNRTSVDTQIEIK